MATGVNADNAPLWKLRVKINTPDGGLNFSLHIAETAEVDARTNFADICARLRIIMPTTCEIFAAVMSKDNTKKDARVMPEAIGPGLYLPVETPPITSTSYNRYDDAILVRAENDDGGWGALKIGPVPDKIITAGDIAVTINNVSGKPAGIIPPIATPIVYEVEFNGLLQAICKNCSHVVTKNHTPGGQYTYFAYKNMIVERVTKKKGGRVSTK